MRTYLIPTDELMRSPRMVGWLECYRCGRPVNAGHVNFMSVPNGPDDCSKEPFCNDCSREANHPDGV